MFEPEDKSLVVDRCSLCSSVQVRKARLRPQTAASRSPSLSSPERRLHFFNLIKNSLVKAIRCHWWILLPLPTLIPIPGTDAAGNQLHLLLDCSVRQQVRMRHERTRISSATVYQLQHLRISLEGGAPTIGTGERNSTAAAKDTTNFHYTSHRNRVPSQDRR